MLLLSLQKVLSDGDHHGAAAERTLAPRSVVMACGEAQAICSFALEIELNENSWFIAHHPGVMTGVNRHDLRGGEFESAAIRIMDVDLAASEEAHVSVHTQVSTHNSFHVGGPAEASWIDNALHAGGAHPDDIEADATDFAIVGVF
jgi:hypothetical protein